jgi:hypothetical protein
VAQVVVVVMGVLVVQVLLDKGMRAVRLQMAVLEVQVVVVVQALLVQMAVQALQRQVQEVLV